MMTISKLQTGMYATADNFNAPLVDCDANFEETDDRLTQGALDIIALQGDLSDLEERVEDLEGQTGGGTTPTGTIIMFAAASAPAGWLLCDGTSYDTTAKAGLFAVIGYTFGGSNNNFNVPDMRGYVPYGTNSSHALASKFGSATHQLSTGEMPVHNHGVSGYLLGGSGNYSYAYAGAGAYATNGGSISNAGSGTAHNNLQPSFSINFIIKE